MKALTLWRPWPYAIFHLPAGVAKRVENRGWKPPANIIGQRIAIHAGKTWDEDGKDFIGEHLAYLGLLPELKKTPGHDARVKAEGIIGTAILCGVAKEFGFSAITLVAGRLPSGPFLECVQEWWSGPYGWLLDDVRTLPEPIPCKGRQGLWNVPDELVARLA